jgi:hypothetical protein
MSDDLTEYDADWPPQHPTSFSPTGTMKRLGLLVFGLLVLGAIACLETSSLRAADASGQYWVGGGIGALPCTEFLNAMKEARQKGGLTSLEGALRINVWTTYVLGFQTGYNYAMPGVRDIFSAFGEDPARQVLYGIEPWCERNPTERFGHALIVFAEGLRKGH